MLSNKKKLIEQYLTPVAVFFKDVNPNILTLLGSIPSLLFFVFVINHWYVLALLAFAGNIFDLIDGMVARKFQKVTAFGGFLDSTMDRVSDFLLITAFAFAGIVCWEIIAPLLLFSFLISYTRARGELAKRDVSFAIGFVERSERLLFIVTALLLFLLFPNVYIFNCNIAEITFLVLLVLSVYTVLQRIIHAYKKL